MNESSINVFIFIEARPPVRTAAPPSPVPEERRHGCIAVGAFPNRAPFMQVKE